MSQVEFNWPVCWAVKWGAFFLFDFLLPICYHLIGLLNAMSSANQSEYKSENKSPAKMVGTRAIKQLWRALVLAATCAAEEIELRKFIVCAQFGHFLLFFLSTLLSCWLSIKLIETFTCVLLREQVRPQIEKQLSSYYVKYNFVANVFTFITTCCVGLVIDQAQACTCPKTYFSSLYYIDPERELSERTLQLK